MVTWSLHDCAFQYFPSTVPGDLVRATCYLGMAGTFLVIYWWWLLCLPLIGAIGAYWSRRTGGKLLERVLAASFPVLGLTCVMVVAFCTGSVIDRQPLSFRLVAFVVYLLGWGILPGVALLLGALPFLRGDAGESRRALVSH